MIKIGDHDYTWFLFALTLIFVAAKAFGFLNWAWYVTAFPIWVPILIIAFAYFLQLLIMIIVFIGYYAVVGFKKVFSHEDD